jgi:Na+/H+ antiporter NhaD/arsenite permease-like protein
MASYHGAMQHARLPLRGTPAAFLLVCAGPAAAASGDPTFDGAALSLAWAIPFAGLLLSIALVPLLSRDFWHHHYGKFSAAWSAALLAPLAWTFGIPEAWHQVVHALVREYIPFVVILFALYTIAGGICVHGPVAGTPGRNTAILGLGAALASLMGTTGASMLLVRPLLAGNEARRHRVHAVVFFILLVGNVGGALSPLGDPPLFIGYLKGVDFFWTTSALLLPTAAICGALLVAFYALDTWYARREPPLTTPAVARGPIWIEGARNIVLLAGVVGAVLMSGMWKPGIEFDVFGTPEPLQALVREGLLVALALVSLAITPRAVREHNVFHWEPIVEVAKLFAGIFVTIIPALAMLAAGRNGALAGVVEFVARPDGTLSNPMVFWATGILSAFLDNAPTYLVFYNLAGGRAELLMGQLAPTLMAISMGAVYFGALTYVGNAPNFMIKAIAEDRGVAMPSFFGYLAYAAILMMPMLAAIAYFVLQ